jgi:hypothetical protein
MATAPETKQTPVYIAFRLWQKDNIGLHSKGKPCVWLAEFFTPISVNDMKIEQAGQPVQVLIFADIVGALLVRLSEEHASEMQHLNFSYGSQQLGKEIPWSDPLPLHEATLYSARRREAGYMGYGVSFVSERAGLHPDLDTVPSLEICVSRNKLSV